jgi:DNA repair exonuclease SbcCD nuclease subunit
MTEIQDRHDGDLLLVHSSDLHVDDDLGISAYNGLVGLQSVLSTADALNADMVLLAGDTFDNHRISTAVLRRTAGMLEAAVRPVVLLPGNHDAALPECLFRRAGIVSLPHVHVLGVTHGESILFGAQDLEIWGHAHYSFADMAPLRGPRPRKSRWQVAMAHGHYVPPEDRQREAHRAWKITDEDLAATCADYVALGHWDRPVQVGDGQVPAYYSGSPDLAGTVNLVRLSPRDGVRVRRTPLLWA